MDLNQIETDAYNGITPHYSDAQQMCTLIRKQEAEIAAMAQLHVVSAAAEGAKVEQTNPHANTFPETIWLNVGDGEPHEVGPYKDLSELSWCGEGIDRYDVKYVRADLAAPQQHAQALPMIPTDDMCRTAREAIGIGSNVADHVWRVMAKAAREGVQQHAQAAQDDRAAHNAGYDAAQKADREMMQSNEHYRERVFNWIVELDTAAGLSRFTHSRVTGNAQAALSDEQIDEISASWHLDGRNASVTLRAFARAILAASHQPAAGK